MNEENFQSTSTSIRNGPGSVTDSPVRENQTDLSIKRLSSSIDETYTLVDSILNKLMPVLRSEPENEKELVEELPTYSSPLAEQIGQYTLKINNLNADMKSILSKLEL